jgi:hypothetical protein
MKKRCFKCGKRKELLEFYKHFAMNDGHLGKCKICARRDTRVNRVKRIEYYLAYDLKRKKGTDVAEYSKRARERHRDAYKARTAVGNAVRDRRLKKLPCEVCGVGKVEAHHSDYKKPLDVIWLCFKHHRMKHGNRFFSDP